MRIVLPSLLAASLLTASTAFPCGNAVFLETKDAALLVKRMESANERGKYRQALQIARRHYEITDPGLRARFERALGTAGLRTGNLPLALQVFRAQVQEHPKDPELLTRLGETHSYIPEDRAEAKKILTALAAKDLIVDAHGYAALARVYRAEGAKDEAEKATQRCERMASERSICHDAKRKQTKLPSMGRSS